MKGLFTNYNGGQPPNGRSLAHYGPKYETNKEKAVHKSTALILRSPSRRSGLLSSLQRSPILRKDKYKKHKKIDFASIY